MAVNIELKANFKELTARLNSRIGTEQKTRKNHILDIENGVKEKISKFEKKIEKEILAQKAVQKQMTENLVKLEKMVMKVFPNVQLASQSALPNFDDKIKKTTVAAGKRKSYESTGKVGVDLNQLDKKNVSIADVEKLCDDLSIKFNSKINEEQKNRCKEINQCRSMLAQRLSQSEIAWEDILKSEKAKTKKLESRMISLENLMKNLSKTERVSQAKPIPKDINPFLEARISTLEQALWKQLSCNSLPHAVEALEHQVQFSKAEGTASYQTGSTDSHVSVQSSRQISNKLSLDEYMLNEYADFDQDEVSEKSSVDDVTSSMVDLSVTGTQPRKTKSSRSRKRGSKKLKNESSSPMTELSNFNIEIKPSANTTMEWKVENKPKRKAAEPQENDHVDPDPIIDAVVDAEPNYTEPIVDAVVGAELHHTEAIRNEVERDASVDTHLINEQSGNELDVSVEVEEELDISVEVEEELDVSVEVEENLDISVEVEEKLDISLEVEEKLDISLEVEEEIYSFGEDSIDSISEGGLSDLDSQTCMETADENLKQLQKQQETFDETYLEKLTDENYVEIVLTSANEKEISQSGPLTVKLKDRVLQDTIEWPIRKRKPTATEIIFHSGTFYTGQPGYRVQLRAQIDRLHGDVYFSVRILQGWFDERLAWPFPLIFSINLSPKMQTCTESEEWIVPPSRRWKKRMEKPENKGDDIFSEWCGPFNMSSFVDVKTLVFDISLDVNK